MAEPRPFDDDKTAMIRALFEHSSDLMHVVDSAGVLLLVNPAWVRLTGYSEAELVGSPALDYFVTEDGEAAAPRLRDMASGVVSEREARIRTRDGRLLWMASRTQKLEDGRYIVTLRDAAAQRARAEELEEARRTRKALSSAAGIGTWEYIPSTDTIFWSDELIQLAGFDPEVVWTPELLFSLVHPDDRAPTEEALERAGASGETVSLEHRIWARDRWLVMRVTVRTERAIDGQYVLKGISEDITELAGARDAARRSERQIRQLVEAAPFAVAMMDHDQRYVVVSPRWAQTFGLEPDSDAGMAMSRAPKRFLLAHAEVMEGFTVSRREDQFIDGAGRAHWLRWEAAPWFDAQGQVGGMVVYADDISALSEARREAQASAARLSLALEAAQAGVYEIDHVRKTVWGSPEFERIVGGPAPGYAATRRLEFPRFHPDDLAAVRQAFVALHRGEKRPGESFEARLLRPDGSERWVRIYHHVLLNRNGRWLKAVGLVQDCDALKRQELALVEAQRAAEAGAEAKSAFLANMSHEIRTPMNGVMGVLHLLKNETALSADGRGLLEEALSCGGMLSELLNDVIDFSKIEAGRLELNSETLDPGELVSGVTRILGPQARAKGLDLVLEIDERVGWVRSEPVRLRQALFNLVGNAVKFTETGRVTVRACWAQPGVLRFEVEDTGIGIPEAAQARLFERFSQADASTTRRFGGSGLGLAITRRLAELMQGEVGFWSREGEGSRFWLEVRAEPVAADDRPEQVSGAMLEGVRALVVEDNATNRMIATKLLEQLGAQVSTAVDGYAGVEAAAEGGFDLILMDIQMPGIDGVEAARRIRAMGGDVAATPIVALTANVLAHQRQAYLDAGMDGVVGKPISPGELLTEIAQAAQRRHDSLVCESAAA
jgi:PAS domain S-box-containing protein